MACPTCAATMEGIGYGMFHCPRCGTLTNCPVDGAVHVPALVKRCQEFEGDLYAGSELYARTQSWQKLWHRLGLEESINTPEKRPQ